jgi:DNA ligase 1
MTLFKPMLAATVEDTSKLVYPLFASIKYDGIRATVQGGKLLSRTLKLIPNKNVQELFPRLPEGLDGELMYGDPASKHVFSDTTSIVMSRNLPAVGIKFYAFDLFGPEQFQARLFNMNVKLLNDARKTIVSVQQKLIHSEEELLRYEQEILDLGYEGLIVRSLDGLYKQGRATLKQGWLLKLKRFIDAEAKITGFYEEMQNTNQAETNLLGRTERSTKQEGMVGKGTLGGFEVTGINGDFKDVEFRVGSGMNAVQKTEFWNRKQFLLGKIVKYKYFPIGVKDKPRLPIFLGFRDKQDI